ncbi:MAG: hypothetical protein V3S98_06140 [Dehalococcoidia bacterium]
MKYPRECEIWRACSKKKGGKHPNVTLRETKHGTRIEATDGRIMASIHVVSYGYGHDVTIDPDAFKEAHRRSRKGEEGLLDLDPNNNDASVPNGPTFGAPDGGGCPESKWVDPNPSASIGLNAKKLLELAKALGGEQVLLEIVDDKIRVKIIGDEAQIVGGRYGYIFPLVVR